MDKGLFGKFADLIAPVEGMSSEDVADAMTQRRTDRWKAACAAGRCAYTDLAATKSQPPAVDSSTTCPGQVGNRYETAGGPVWRYHRCARMMDWIARRNEYVRQSGGGKKPRNAYGDE